MTQVILIRWLKQLMHITTHRRPPEELPEKEEFEEAKRASEEARLYARASIDKARLEMNWLEDALTPIEKRRRENWLG